MIYVPTFGGANKANRLLFEAFAQANHECEVVAPAIGSHGPQTPEELSSALDQRGAEIIQTTSEACIFRYHGVKVHAVFPRDGIHAFAANHLRVFQPDWVFVTSEDPGQTLLENAVNLFAERTIYVVHTPMQLPFGPLCLSPNAAQTALIRRAAGIITVSEHTRDYVREWGGVESTILRFPAYGPGPFADLSSCNSGYVTLVNPSAYKGISIFVELARRLPEMLFAAVPTWGTTAADLATLQKFKNIHLLVPEDDIEKILARTRLLVMPSLWTEAFPLLPIEAMLRGIPVVASNAGGLPEAKLGVDYVLPVNIITEYQQKFDERDYPVPVVPPQDVIPWEAAVREISTNPERYREISMHSRYAAHEFVSQIGIKPFEDFLMHCRASRKNVVPEALPAMELNCGQTGVLETLSSKRRALLQLRAIRSSREIEILGIESMDRKSIPQPWPLSCMEERLWFLDQLEPGNPGYNSWAGIRLEGKLDIEALKASLNEIIRRHEILRTSFHSGTAGPRREILPELSVELPMVNLETVVPSNQQVELRRLVNKESERPFNLTRAPLLRITLARLKENSHVLLYGMHHIISDAWSMGVILRELAVLYQSFTSKQRSPLPDLKIQYLDFAVWQRRAVSQSPWEQHLEYWRHRLEGLSSLSELPTDHPRPSVKSYRGATHPISLSTVLVKKLNELARAESATLFITLLAGLKVVLHRYTHRRDIAVGSPIANRNRPEVEGLIGFFVNTVVLRTEVDSRCTFRELLQRVRKTTLEAYEHQDVPYAQVVEAVSPERTINSNPLFQVMFGLIKNPFKISELAGLQWTAISFPKTAARFDLEFILTESENVVVGEIQYATDLYDQESITRLAEHFVTVLEHATADPEEMVESLSLLPAAERHQVIVAWNQTRSPYPPQKSVIDFFEEQARQQPELPALSCENRHLTYGELNALANQLAHYLQNQGVGPEVRVGICMERSVEMVVSLIGILKAGGAYVPLDPSYPPERLAFMVRDAQPAVILSQAHLTGVLPAGSREVCLDMTWQEIAAYPNSNPRKKTVGANSVYIIYTSGSTGMPKGVTNTNEGLSNRLAWMQREYKLTVEDSVLQKTPFGFDVSVWEFFWPLMFGARLVMARPGGHQEPAYLAELIQLEKITTIHFVPSMLQAFLSEPAAIQCTNLRRVICSGEALPKVLEENFHQWMPAALHNLYGPTEASIDVSYWACRRECKLKTVPIGRPIANTQIYLLSSAMEPVPVGVSGELYIGGDGIARGYHGRPELTAEKFVPNPWSLQGGERLYRSGDVCRFLPDGNIDYLGRMDHQIKIRGFRVELGEIEAALLQHPNIRQAAVIVQTNGNDKRLAAFVSLRKPFEDAGELSDTLKTFLRVTLPHYMIPSLFIVLETLPLNSSGKLNRRALTVPDSARAQSAVPYSAPRSVLETELAQMWQTLLKVERVGIHDNFFDLGGHSLLLTQLSSRIQAAYGVNIPLRTLFTGPTVVEISMAIAAAQMQEQDPAELEKILAELETENS
jgi:amino acid adenylation domain-containing protein